MPMKRMERVKRDVAAAHVRKTARPETIAFATRLELENARLWLLLGTRALDGRQRSAR